MSKDFLIRVLGYGLLAVAFGWVGCGGGVTPYVDFPNLIMMGLGVLGALWVGLGADFWPALRAWPLGEGVDAARARALERVCGLAIPASVVMGLATFVLDVMIMAHGAAKEPLSVQSWLAGGVVCLSALLYTAVFVWFFAAHRARVGRWFAERQQK